MNEQLALFESNLDKPRKTIVQSNSITTSKRSWTAAENKVLYIILSQIMEFKRLNGAEIDLTEDLLMTFDGSVLLEADKCITRAVDTLKSLRERSIEIYNGKRRVVVGFINYADYDTQSHEVKVQISSKILPFFFSLTERFTQFALGTALECNSIYSQRLFELCAMFAQCGWFSFNLEEFRDVLSIKGYNEKKDLIKRSVKDPRSELLDLYNNELSDLFFTFFEKNSNITFLVHQRNEPVRNNVQWANLISVLLSNVMNYKQVDIDEIFAQYSLQSHSFKGLFKQLAMVNIHVKSKVEQRAKVAEILFSHGIHPTQINAKNAVQ